MDARKNPTATLPTDASKTLNFGVVTSSDDDDCGFTVSLSDVDDTGDSNTVAVSSAAVQ